MINILIRINFICEKPIPIDKVEIKLIVLYRKDSHGNKGAFKYFIGYKSNAGIIPLYIKLPKMNAYAKYFKDSKLVNLLVHDKGLLKKHNEVWNTDLIQIDFYSELKMKIHNS